MVFGVGDLAYSSDVISYAVLVGLTALSIALALSAGINLRFHVLKVQPRITELMIEDVRSKEE